MTTLRKRMEDRRLRGVTLLAGGKTQAEVARACGVSRTTASRWVKQLKEGRDFRSRKATGRPARLTAVQKEALRTLWATRDPNSWTGVMFAAAIKKSTGVTYDVDHVLRLIVQMGLRGKLKTRGPHK